MNNKKCITLTEVDEIVDEQDLIIEKLKKELKLATDNYITLKKQSNSISKADVTIEFEKKLAALAEEKNNLEKKYNDLVADQNEAKQQAEIRKSNLRQKRKNLVNEIDSFIESLRILRSS